MALTATLTVTVTHDPGRTQVELKTVQGIEHMVVGTSEEKTGIRNANALRSFLMDAFRYALSESYEHAAGRACPLSLSRSLTNP